MRLRRRKEKTTQHLPPSLHPHFISRTSCPFPFHSLSLYIPPVPSPDLPPPHPGRPRRVSLLPGPVRPVVRGRLADGSGRDQAARMVVETARDSGGGGPLGAAPARPHLLPGKRGQHGDAAPLFAGPGAELRVRGPGAELPGVWTVQRLADRGEKRRREGAGSVSALLLRPPAVPGPPLCRS